jgi:hypothetical protein
MKTHFLFLFLLILMMTSSVFAQSHNQLNSPAIPDHPLVKTLNLLNKGFTQPIHAKRSKIQTFELSETETQNWIDEEWQPYRKIENRYELGNLVEKNIYLFRIPGENWDLAFNDSFTYENGNLKTEIYQNFLEGNFAFRYRILNSYQQGESQQYLSMIVFQEWDFDLNIWEDDDKTSVILENGIFSEILFEIWEDGEWMMDSKYIYDEFEGDVVETYQVYDTELDDWKNSEQYIYSEISKTEIYNRLTDILEIVDSGRSYISLQILPDYIYYEWDELEKAWIPFDRQITTESTNLRNGATSARSILTESYNNSTEAWKPNFEYVFGYAENQELVNFSIYRGDENTGEGVDNFSIRFSEDYFYNENDLLQSIMRYGNLYRKAFKQTNDELPLVSRVLLNWAEVSTSIQNISDPYTYKIHPAYPNPFNPSTVVPFQTQTASDVTIRVFDMLGRIVATLVDEFMPAGYHTVQFDASGLSSGVYMIRFDAGGVQQTRSVSLIK